MLVVAGITLKALRCGGKGSDRQKPQSLEMVGDPFKDKPVLR
jgi:hypothetical protein